MKNLLGLILVVGLVVAGWMNRERLSGLIGKPTMLSDSEVPASSQTTSRPGSQAAGPVAAHDAQKLAQKLYPGLAIPNSPMNKRFVELYNQAKSLEPTLFNREDWPVVLAERAIVSLGGSPLPRPAATPVGSATMMGTALDKRPGDVYTAPRPPRY